MNDVITKRRPMIDLDEFERRLGRPCSTVQRDGDPLAELLRIIGDKDEPHKTDLEPKTQLSAMARPDIGETGEWKRADAQVHLVGGDFAAVEAGLLGTKQPEATILRGGYKMPNARAPLLSGDFAAIEAGLLGALREQATATVPETDMANAFPSVDLGSERRLYQHDQPTSRHTGVASGHIKSRRAPYVMGAFLLIGMAGVAVSFGLNSRLSGQSDIASIKAENGPDNPQTDAMSSADVPAQDAANLSEPSEPSPTALDNGTKRIFDLSQAEEKTLPVESHAELDNGPPAAPVMTPAQVQKPAEPLSTPVESNDTPPQANINGALLPAPQSPAAAKPPTPKAAGRIVKPLKPAAARHPGSNGQPRQIANKAKATPVNPLNTEPAPIADPKAETPTTQPSPVTNAGPLGLVQSAVNSLTSTTAKLFEWGRN
ncbi:MAG: hypothetical protein ABSD11_21005 [Methylocella sp.]|jgi:hypothetical protein